MGSRTELSIVGGKWLRVINDTSTYGDSFHDNFLILKNIITIRQRNPKYASIVIETPTARASIFEWTTLEVAKFLEEAEFAIVLEETLEKK